MTVLSVVETTVAVLALTKPVTVSAVAYEPRTSVVSALSISALTISVFVKTLVDSDGNPLSVRIVGLTGSIAITVLCAPDNVFSETIFPTAYTHPPLATCTWNAGTVVWSIAFTEK